MTNKPAPRPRFQYDAEAIERERRGWRKTPLTQREYEELEKVFAEALKELDEAPD